MISACILIQTQVSRVPDVEREVARIEGVISAEQVTGPYDVIARAEARDLDELGKLSGEQDPGGRGIARTLTCPVAHL
jgi:DNA-binding Lrp family transcriptional regulator